MQHVFSLASVLAFTGGLALAQSTGAPLNDATPNSRSLTGLLVAAGCQTSSGAIGRSGYTATKQSNSLHRSTPSSYDEQNQTYEQQQNQVDRGKMARTTPGQSSVTATDSVDRNRTYEQEQNEANRSNLPRSTDRPGRQTSDRVPAATDTVSTPPVDAENTRGSAPLNDPKEDDRMLARDMDASCRIGERTTAFALRMDDGNLVAFDSASNAQIARQLASGGRLKHQTKIFRAEVKGSVQGGIIHSDAIRM